MTIECPKCKSPVARDGQRFCYRCGNDLNTYYDSLKMDVAPSGASDPLWNASSSSDAPKDAGSAEPKPESTVVLEANAFKTTTDTPQPSPPKASLKILLPTGDVFDRELTNAETQIGKGPRNDVVIADPAVSTAHAMLRMEGSKFTITDIGSRNGTYVNGDRVANPRQLNHGDVIGIGLSKLTFRIEDYSETGAIEKDVVEAAMKKAGPPPLTEDSLATAVINAGLVSKADIDRIRSDSKGRRLYKALVEEQLASEESLRDLISRTFQIPSIDLNNSKIDETVAGEFPARLARELLVVPVAKEGDNLILAVSDPTDSDNLERVRREVRSPVSLRIATATQIREQVDRHYGPKLIGVLPSGEKLEYLINKHDVEIGKAPHNHITLTDPTVSNTHAIVTTREAGFTIVDLGSRNGTFVNGERLGSQAITLRHGDKIQLGQTVLTFRNPGETAANITAVLSGEAVEEVRRRALSSSEREAAKSKQEKSTAEGPGQGASAIATAGQAETAAADAAEDEKGDKKKKKKKKKGGDERLRAAYISGLSRIVAQVMGVVLAVLLALYVNSMRSGSDKPVIETSTKGKAKLKIPASAGGMRFDGGPFEASGVVGVPGGNGVLFIDDGRSEEVLWMQIDESGRQSGPIQPVPLGVSVDDPEGITSDGTYFYIVGSQSSEKAGDRNALVRFAFDAASKTAQNAEMMSNLRDFLITNLPELNTGKKASEGGLNIEGIAWDFKRGRWLLGLRAPLKDGNALVAAIKLKNPAGSFSIDNLQLAEPNLIQLKLGGMGVRDMNFDPESNSFMIISGAPEHLEKTEFTLWEWSGESGSDSALRREQDLDPKLKPEGITHVELGGRKFLFLVCDANAYLKLDYAEAQ
jgi:pSer/pThr/pTyr-binding forkhead associated (FHA) protein